MSSCTKILSDFVVETSYKDIPSQAIEVAKCAIMDTIGVGIRGSREPVSVLVRELVLEECCREEATIIGTHLRSSILNCAFCNGISFHTLDYDDSLYNFEDPTKIHPSSPILAACFPLSEKVGAKGADIIEAFVLGVEVISALNKGLGASHYNRGWHATATLGALGATAAASKLMNLESKELQVAFGITVSFMSGSRQNFGTMVKPIHVGHAARNAVLSAIMSAKGVTADENILDEPMGFALFSEEGDWNVEKAVTSLGDPWGFISPGVRVKQYPSCGGTHRPLHALFQILEQNDINATNIKEVFVFEPDYPPIMIHHRPKTGLQGKFSTEYCIASGLIDGHVSMGSFTDLEVLRPDKQAFLEKVTVIKKADPLDFGVRVEIECKDGSRYSSGEVLHFPGTPLYPLTWTELEEKYRDCVCPRLSLEDVEESIKIIKDFENLTSISAFINILGKSS